MMGQPGGGKSFIVDQLAKRYNFMVINEIISGRIRRNPDLLAGYIEEMKLNGRSIVIDGTHPTRKMRQVYVDFLDKINYRIPINIGWVTRPGFRLNKLRETPTPSIALRLYRDHFEAPEKDEGWFRII
jgi:predicted kinase